MIVRDLLERHWRAAGLIFCFAYFLVGISYVASTLADKRITNRLVRPFRRFVVFFAGAGVTALVQYHAAG